jgi:thioredoxin-related protein
MKSIIVFSLILLPFFLNAQDENGIKFEKGLTWEQIKERAHAENKYVFVDCFATWCAPCKKMDKETYEDNKVGSAVNPKFIAVKVQMDSTKDDNEQTRKWYGAVKQIKMKYIIPAYPTYLFFSPEGQLVHQDEGYKDPEQFISLINTVLDQSKQFASIIEEYRKGKHDASTVIDAANAAKKFSSKALADSIARSYKSEYLDKIEDKDLFTKLNILFVTQDFAFLFYDDGSRGRFFNYFYKYPKVVDSLVMRTGYANFYVENIIKNEELISVLFPTSNSIINRSPVTRNPKWEIIKQEIAKKYSAVLADKIVTDYKPGFYRQIGNWRKWAAIMDEKFKNTKLEKGGKNLGNFSDDWVLNDYAWSVFKNCNDKKVLKKALAWSEISIKLKKEGHGLEQYLDTKANLLYKLGKVKQAIETEEKAFSLNQQFLKERGKESDNNDEIYREVIHKMKAGVPTWKIK